MCPRCCANSSSPPGISSRAGPPSGAWLRLAASVCAAGTGRRGRGARGARDGGAGAPAGTTVEARVAEDFPAGLADPGSPAPGGSPGPANPGPANPGLASPEPASPGQIASYQMVEEI